MITLYGATASRAHRVIWMLKELELPFKHEPIDFIDGSTRTKQFLAINPNGRVPVLQDDDFLIYESLAINLYLARRYRADLSPQGWREDALATQWSFWVVTEIEKPLLLASANRALFSPENRRDAEADVALSKLTRPWKVLDEHLSRHHWLLGERFTVADLNIATVMDLAPQCAISLDAWPHLQEWHQRCLHRPHASDWRDVRFAIPRPHDELGMLSMFV